LYLGRKAVGGAGSEASRQQCLWNILHLYFVFLYFFIIIRELAGIDAGPTTETFGWTSGSPNLGANPGIAGVGALDEFRRSFLNNRW